MKTAGELFEDAILEWRDKKGVGTAIIPSPLNDKVMVLGILQRIYNRSPNTTTIIIVNTFSERTNLIEFLTHQEEGENNAEFKSLISDKTIKLLTEDFIKNRGFNTRPTLCILYHPTELSTDTSNILRYAKYKLVVLNKLLSSSNDMKEIYSKSPLLSSFKQNEIDEVRISTPVEDEWINVTIPDDSKEDKLLKYYDEYIATSLNIFGSFEIMQQAHLGDNKLNISSNQICNQIAKENGWNEHLDMSVEINIQLDELYNPGSIKERATKTYEIIRNRAQLLSDYEGKLEEILTIIKKHSNEKILIINKRGEFANKVTEYINNNSETNICANYHDKVEPIPATDINGKPLYYKSGPRKGERRFMAAQAQKTRNVELFNANKINVLSTNAAPDKDLNIDVDVIIITSPLCDTIKSYMYRLDKVFYPKQKLKLYSIYIKNSLEESKLMSKELANIHTIVNKCENSVVSENNFDYIVVD